MSAVNNADDFDRNVWCLLGLVFDAVDLKAASRAVHIAVLDNSNCFISTPNLNFTIAALDDPEFLKSIINSDLSLIDGMPLLWVARLLGSGLDTKVSGSDLFDELCRYSDPDGNNLKVFFFGGEEGIGEQACNKINSVKGGLTCAGYLNPGFGSNDEISSQDIIDRLNESKSDFLVVALGAKKGQNWINQNHERLNIPVVSHLGAVLNFVAGNVKRAPLWMQRSGLEWVWRIQQEPSLWRRYFFDGLGLARLFFSRILPYAFWRLTHTGLLANDQPVSCKVDVSRDQIIIRISGSCLHANIEPLRTIFCEVSVQAKSVKLDLSRVPVVDGAFLGLCLVLLKHVKKTGRKLSVSGLSPNLVRIFHWNCVEFLL